MIEASATRPLFERVPGLRDHVAWLPLAALPTPLEPIDIIARDGTRRILVKRDDLTGRPYGGNKVRKLEFLLGEARRCGAGRLITAGAAGSHHALATAVHGRALGFDVSLVLFPQNRTEHVRRTLLMDYGSGAELRWTRRMEGVPFATLRARFAHRDERPYVIAPGGSCAIGTLGYVNAGLELAEQLASLPEPAAVVHVAAGTLGTVAGLAIGLALAGRPLPIEATRITSRIVANEMALRRLIADVLDLLERAGASVPPADEVAGAIDLRHDQIGDGYGRETEAGRAALDAFGRAGLTLDATYTAKSAAALLSDAPPAEGVPLFLHTLSAVEPTDRLEGVDASALPEPFARYLERASRAG